MENSIRQPTLYMLTTIDNPYDPFTEWDQWYALDAQLGYNTPAYLGRVAKVSDELSEADYILEINNSIDDILRSDPTGLYYKVKEGDFKRLKNS
jgi:hypothetical protein